MVDFFMKIKVDQASSTDDKKINKVIHDSEKEIEDFIKNLENDEPKLDYDGFYKLTGHKLTGRMSDASVHEIDAKLEDIIDEF